jgi:hypothetical protein
VSFPHPEIEQKFWAKVDRRGDHECWPWTGRRNHKAYGRLRIDGRGRPAQQIAWEVANKMPFPAGKMGCHTCDNPPCCNPAHIWPGTALENQIDCVAKGRRLHLLVPKPARIKRVSGRGRFAEACPAGHSYTPENTFRDSEGYRRCLICNRAQWRSSYERRRAAAK